MDKATFLATAQARGIRPDAYRLDGGGDECYAIEAGLLVWSTFYSERGMKRGAKRFRSESDALLDLLRRLDADPSTATRPTS